MKRAKLGNVEFTVTQAEDITESAEITSNPVEDGKDVSDHVKQNPSQLSISGTMTGNDATNKFNTLKKYKEEGQLLHYIGRAKYSNMVISSINKSYSSNIKNGFSFDLSLSEVRIATAKRVSIRVSAPKKKVKVLSNDVEVVSDSRVVTRIKKSTNKGLQQAEPKKVVPKTFSPTSIDDTLKPYKAVS